MNALWERVQARFDAATAEERRGATAIAIASAIFLVHYSLLSWWYVEDAAISFTFSRHAAAGQGFVAVLGGERMEGFSNPTWTLALAGLDRVGVNPFIGAKWLGALFGVLTLPAAWSWARRLLPSDAGAAGAIAPIILACSPQFVIWEASGLENSLFVVLLAWGSVRLLDEIEHGGWPLSGLFLGLLGASRPEAPLYTAAVLAYGVCLMPLYGVRALRPIGLGLVAAIPIGLWQEFRQSYFGWPLPNTYYAKLAEAGGGSFETAVWWAKHKDALLHGGVGDLESYGWGKFQPFSWDGPGWKYARNYSLESAMGFMPWALALGSAGLRGWRAVVAGVIVAIGLLLLIPGLGWPQFALGKDHWPPFESQGLDVVRILWICLGSVVVAALGIGRPGASARLLAWLIGGIASFFVLYSGGDWMAGWRWLSMASVPLAVLLADASWQLADRLSALGRRGWDVGFALVLLPPVLVGIGGTIGFLTAPETMPYDVRRRVIYMQGVADRLALDHVTLMDVDMGAHMWWSGFDIIDMAGLVDVPMAHHKWQKPFVHEYVYEEKRPEFAHVHGSWASRTRMTTHKEWAKEYVEIDPYPISPWTSHPGCNVRRDLILPIGWTGQEGRTAGFANGVELVGLDVPQPAVAPGGELYVEIGLKWPIGKKKELRPLLGLACGDQLVVRDLPPAYDWVPATSWKKDEVAVGRHAITLPETLPPGPCDLVVAMVGEGGEISAAEDVIDGPPRIVPGEMRWQAAVQVFPAADQLAAADREVAEIVAKADAGDCASAESAWKATRRRMPRRDAWQDDAHTRIDGPIARCLVARARAESGSTRIADIEAARRWDVDEPQVWALGESEARSLAADGDAAFAAGDMETAYAAYSDALRVDPMRADLRRKAEQARDVRLHLKSDDEPPKVEAGGD